MNERLRRYVVNKAQEEKKKEQAYRQKILLEEGLFEKEFPLNDNQLDYNVYTEWDAEARRYYRPVPIDVSDEEFAQIEKYCANRKNQEEGMFSNIGKKLMGLAIVLFWLDIVGCFFGGLIYVKDMPKEEAPFVWIGIVLVGVLVAYISSWFLYGLGQLIDDTHAIRKKTDKEEQ